MFAMSNVSRSGCIEGIEYEGFKILPIVFRQNTPKWLVSSRDLNRDRDLFSRDQDETLVRLETVTLASLGTIGAMAQWV